jgi:hypothetical protein
LGNKAGKNIKLVDAVRGKEIVDNTVEQDTGEPNGGG